MTRFPFYLALAGAMLSTAVARQADAEEKVARGKYLVTTSGCHDCHTPWKVGPKGPEPDMSRALSGHPADVNLPPAPKASGPWIVSASATNTAWSGPWGVSFTANLTPDAETGLGKWSFKNFKVPRELVLPLHRVRADAHPLPQQARRRPG